MTSAVYDYAAGEKKMRHLEAANVFENVDSSHGIHDRGPLQAGRQPRGVVLPDGALPQELPEILRELGLPSPNPPRLIGE